MGILSGFDPEAVRQGAELLKSGGIVAFPTETVYGLGADASNPVAVARVFELKNRPHFDPLIVHIADKRSVAKLADNVTPEARLLMDRFWPGPLTIILSKKSVVPDIVTAGLPTVAVRMPEHKVALDLINALGRPVAAPSANPFGYMSTTTAGDVARVFGGRLPLILDGGPSSYGIESTVVSVRAGTVVVHRHGSVTMEELVQVAGTVVERDRHDLTCESPGQMPYHYAPHTALKIIEHTEEIEEANSAFLAFTRPQAPVNARCLRVLSEHGDFREAAARFFSYLIELDREGLDIIYAEKIPEKGLGKAMMERLEKASKRAQFVNH